MSNGRTPSTKHAGTRREEVKKSQCQEGQEDTTTQPYGLSFLIDISCVPDLLSYFPQGGPYPGHCG